ncbi:hypothetical protein AV530_006009 [Patagioenas fasciata monilis]|uniref:Uncharacterized protein n=1 Tax=Patagioenas fasciata monilis TaxID=372326 RepID=A0A1V4JND4_PATFA|nr:hypothetical protein AV530_006009 [Patagioenas fasciata monilis]
MGGSMCDDSSLCGYQKLVLPTKLTGCCTVRPFVHWLHELLSGKREFLLSTGLLSAEQELMLIVWQVLDKIMETRNTKDCKGEDVNLASKQNLQLMRLRRQ